MADARLGISVSADAKQASATFKDLAEDIKKVGKESVGVTDGVDKVSTALAKLAKASDTPGALAEAVARAKLEVDELRSSLEKTPASAQKISAINAALAQADSAIQRSIDRAAKLKDTQEQVNAKIGLTAKGAAALAELGKSVTAAEQMREAAEADRLGKDRWAVLNLVLVLGLQALRELGPSTPEPKFGGGPS